MIKSHIIRATNIDKEDLDVLIILNSFANVPMPGDTPGLPKIKLDYFVRDLDKFSENAYRRFLYDILISPVVCSRFIMVGIPSVHFEKNDFNYTHRDPGGNLSITKINKKNISYRERRTISQIDVKECFCVHGIKDISYKEKDILSSVVGEKVNNACCVYDEFYIDGYTEISIPNPKNIHQIFFIIETK